jgi:Tfp pilus assembly protein PilF
MLIDIDQLNADAYYNRGLCALAKSDILDAEFNFKQALNINPDYKAAKDGLANIKKTIK